MNFNYLSRRGEIGQVFLKTGGGGGGGAGGGGGGVVGTFAI